MGCQKEDAAKMSREEQLQAFRLRVEEQKEQWARIKQALARLGDVELEVPNEFFEAFERVTRVNRPNTLGIRA